jgi:hypothetical protein
MEPERTPANFNRVVVQTEHLSFVETGRSSPSRQILVHLAQHRDLPFAERNRLLLAGGFALPPGAPRAQRGSPSSARPDLPEHAPSYPAQAAIAAATKPDPVVIADPCKQVRCRSRAALTGWHKTACPPCSTKRPAT